MKKFMCVLLALVMIFALAACQSGNSNGSANTNTENSANTNDNQNTAPASNFPQKTLELVACYSAGGGHDIMLRTIMSIIQKYNFTGATMTVNNVTGGSGSKGQTYVYNHKGDGHYLMSNSASIITTPITIDLGFKYSDFTPIAMFCFDPQVMVVRADSGVKTMEELMAKQNVNVAGTGSGSIDHVILNKLIKVTGNTTLNFVPYQSDGESMTALLGKQVDALSTNLNTIMDYVSTGEFVVLAVSTPERCDMIPDVRTFKEIGYDFSIAQIRSVYCPPDTPKEAVDFWVDILKKVWDTPEFQDEYMKANGMMPYWAATDDCRKIYDEQYAIFAEIMEEVGLAYWSKK